MDITLLAGRQRTRKAMNEWGVEWGVNETEGERTGRVQGEGTGESS